MNRLIWAPLALSLAAASAQDRHDPAKGDRPGLFFREDFKEIEIALPITQAHIANASLVMGLYGPGKDKIKKSHHDKPADDPYYVWSGECLGNWAFTLRHRNQMVDLRGFAKIRWRSHQTGFRILRPIIKLADGAWLVGDAADGPSDDWRVIEMNVSDIRWRKLDIEKVVEGSWVAAPDLSRVAEIGWTDLMAGGRTPASSRVDWIEVYGRPVPLAKAAPSGE